MAHDEITPLDGPEILVDEGGQEITPDDARAGMSHAKRRTLELQNTQHENYISEGARQAYRNQSLVGTGGNSENLRLPGERRQIEVADVSVLDAVDAVPLNTPVNGAGREATRPDGL